MPTADQIVQSELRAGEKLLWSGQPRGGIRFRPSDRFFFPFSMMWGGSALFWEVRELTTVFDTTTERPFATRIISPLWGVPFVLVGLYIMFGRFVVDAKRRERTYYAVTDQRIIIISTWFSHKVQSLILRQIPELSLGEGANGSGSITFGSTDTAFDMVDNVRNVYDIIQRAQQQAV